MMTTGLIVALIALGLVLILLELFVTPGFVTGLLGGVAWVYALYKIYNIYGEISGHLALCGMILLLIACVFVAVKSGFWNRVSLNQNVDGKVNELPVLEIGEKGYTISVCMPVGKVNFNGVIVEATSTGDLIQNAEQVEVVSLTNNKVFIKQI